MLLGLREHEDLKTGVRTAAQMSVFNNIGTVERVRGFATCKKLKLSGSQGMYVVFAKDDQGSGLGFGYEQKVAEKCSTRGGVDQVWNETRCWYFEASKSVQLRRFKLQGCRFSQREVKDQVLVVKTKLKWRSVLSQRKNRSQSHWVHEMRFKVRVCLEILVKSRGKYAGRIWNCHGGLSKRFQRNILIRNKGRQAWCYDQSRQGGALGQRGKAVNHQKDEIVIFQGENTCRLDKYGNQAWTGHSQVSEETLQGLEFDMEEDVRVYLDRLQRMHAPKVSWWSLRRGYRGCTHQRFLGGVCAVVIVLHDKLQLKKLAMGLSLTWKKLSGSGVVWHDQLISTALRVCSRWSLAGQGYEVNQKSLQRYHSCRLQRCRMMFKIRCSFRFRKSFRPASASIFFCRKIGFKVEAEVSMVIIKWMVVIEVIGLYGFEEMVVIGRASGLRFQGKATKKSSCCIELDTCVMLGGNLFKEY
ncbi:hypothetical protein F2Q70_00044438 [Brassica cretica]|uniref:Uncharacterized protein n=1 Tax=Brassica cretica TaxID=69181 RepID=A0A8S9KMS7_BRACR|nr:hypothetical protein F2Q70_00044438 [Brassica cretica]